MYALLFHSVEYVYIYIYIEVEGIASEDLFYVVYFLITAAPTYDEDREREFSYIYIWWR